MRSKSTKTCSACTATADVRRSRTRSTRVAERGRPATPSRRAGVRDAIIAIARLAVCHRARVLRGRAGVVRPVDQGFLRAERSRTSVRRLSRPDGRAMRLTECTAPASQRRVVERQSAERQLSERRRHESATRSPGARVREGRQISLVVSTGVHDFCDARSAVRIAAQREPRSARDLKLLLGGRRRWLRTRTCRRTASSRKIPRR